MLQNSNMIMTVSETPETEDQQTTRLNRLRSAEISRRFAEIDCERIRPLSAAVLGIATKEDMDKLTKLEEEATALRAELAELGETD